MKKHKPQPIFLLSIQRSGTNFFRRVLGSNNAINPLFGEVFDPNHLKKPLSFFNYKRKQVSIDPNFTLPDQQLTLFKMYLDHLAANCEEKYFVVDIKYNSMWHLNSYWPSEKHVLIDYLLECNYPIIHLVRNDLLAAIYSQMLALKTGVYVLKKKQNDLAIESTQVDCKAISSKMMNRKRQITRHSSLLQECDFLEIIYEDLLNEKGLINQKVISQIAAYLKLNPNDFSREQPTKKIVKEPIEKLIKNFSDLEIYFAKKKISRYYTNE